MLLSDKIKMLRKRENLTQTELGEKVGVKKNAVSKWECGRVENIPTSTIKALADLFNVTTAYLIDDDLPAKQPPHGLLPLPPTKKRPLVGSIACGTPILAEQNITDYIDVPDDVPCDFCLICKGDSMIDANISDGDVVYIRTGIDIHNGDIAAVLIGDEATLKRVYLDEARKSLTLVPANAQYAPVTYSNADLDGIRIEGKAVGFTHLF